MKSLSTVAIIAALTLPASGVFAQPTPDATRAAFDQIVGSVVRIRTIADLASEDVASRNGQEIEARPYSVDGSGVVVGSMEVDGRREYLILTNHHVADASNYVLEDGGSLRVNAANTLAAPRVKEESFLMHASVEEVSSADVRLVEIVRRVRGDMTLMRTDGIERELPVFGGEIGYREGEIEAGAAVLTSGFPWGGYQIAAMGQIVEVGYLHDLGLPHEDFIVDLPIEPGQSGGPLFLIEGDPELGEPITFRLIGLVHARDRERSYGVAYHGWQEALDEFPAELQSRMIR